MNPPPSTVRILLADDHELVRRGIRALLECQPGFSICGEAVDGRDAVRKAVELRPDILVLDITMPLMNGLDATRQIHQAVPETRIVVLTMHESEQLLREILSAGAMAYVLKSDAGKDLTAAIDALLEGKTFVSSSCASDASAQARKLSPKVCSPSSVLTRREIEILQLLAEGKSNKEAGAVLEISVKTVETHRARIMRKLGITSVAGLVKYAIRNHFVTP